MKVCVLWECVWNFSLDDWFKVYVGGLNCRHWLHFLVFWMASRILSCHFDFEFQILLELGMKFWKFLCWLSWSLEVESLLSWEVWGFWVVLEWDARSVCGFKLIMMVFFFLMQLGVRCVRVDGVNTVFKFLRCKGKFIFLEWCAHWVVKLFWIVFWS